jgi:hypothetical protein
MTKYYEFLGWGDYQTEEDWDFQPYPQDWLRIQQSLTEPDEALQSSGNSPRRKAKRITSD